MIYYLYNDVNTRQFFCLDKGARVLENVIEFKHHIYLLFSLVLKISDLRKNVFQAIDP